jgi:cobalt-zinc-cadmium efflux system outer membrane protein
MWYRKFKFALLFLTVFVMGCQEQNTTEVHQGEPQKINETDLTSSVKDPAELKIEITEIAEPNGILTLRHALALTAMNNPELKVFSLETRAAQSRQLQAGLWPNPEVDIEVENVGGTGPFSGFDAAQTTIMLSQLIEIGSKSQKRKKVASFEKDLADLDYQNKRLEIFSQAAKAFVQVLKAQKKLHLSSELMDLAEKSYATVEKRVNAGKDSPVEKTRASVALANIKISHSKTRRNLEYARKRLASFWGQNKPLFKQAAGNLDRVEQLPPLEDLADQLKLTPQYTRWETAIKKSQATLELEKARAKGDITIGAGLKRFNDINDNTVVFGVSIPLQISDRNQGAKQAAIFNLAKSKQEQRVAWLKLQNEFNETYQKYTNSYSQAISLKDEVLPAATDMFNAATRAYREGKVDYLNVLDAQRTLFDVRNEYIENLADYHIARTDIERLIGSQTETVNIPESEH